jgi:hypothetical protein
MCSLEVAVAAPAAAADPELYAGPAIVRLYRLQLDPAAGGKPLPLPKRALLLAGDCAAVATAIVGGAWPRVVRFLGVTAGTYTVAAFVDGGGGELDFSKPQPLGWLCSAGGYGGAGSVLTVDGRAAATTAVTLRHATPPPTTDRAVPGGMAGWRGGCNVVHLRGSSPYGRGVAQGQLLGRQVLDFLEYYIVEEASGGPARYAVLHAIFGSELYATPKEFDAEAAGLIAGVVEATGGGYLETLGRPLDVVDVACLNSVVLVGVTLAEWAAGRLGGLTFGQAAAAAETVDAVESAGAECTQFGCWGAATAGGDAAGGTIVGRNMDGEVDVRKVTVTHLILLAVDRSDPPAGHDRAAAKPERAGQRHVSVSWPGGIGVSTGLNSAGLWCASNAGSMRGPPFLVPDGSGPAGSHPLNSNCIRTLLDAPLPQSPAPAEAVAVLHSVAAPSGGIRPGGCLLIAQPYRGQAHGGAYVYEGDHTGGQIRTAEQSADFAPHQPDCVMVTNHNMVRGCEADRPGGVSGAGPSAVFGRPVGFSSTWRYQAGASRLAALRRANQPIGTEQMKQLLQVGRRPTLPLLPSRKPPLAPPAESRLRVLTAAHRR